MSRNRWIFAAALLAIAAIGLSTMPGVAEAGRRHRGGWGCGCYTTSCWTGCCNPCATSCCDTGCGYTAAYFGSSSCLGCESGAPIQSAPMQAPEMGSQTFQQQDQPAPPAPPPARPQGKL